MNETKTADLAVTRSESRIDKSWWGRGPWDDEPDLVEWTSSEINDRIEVHGELTFGGQGVAGLWVFGFDCGHAYDQQPALDARTKQITGRSFSEAMNQIDDGSLFRTTYKALPFVRAECESLARQLAAMGPPALTEGSASGFETTVEPMPPGEPNAAPAELSPREVAFYEALVAKEGSASSELLAAAMMGFTMREHVRDAHAGREEECSHAAPPDEPERSWWLFGYNFEEPGTVARALETESELEP